MNAVATNESGGTHRWAPATRRTPAQKEAIAYRWRNRRNANLTAAERAAFDLVKSLRLPAYIIHSELKAVIFRADGEHYWDRSLGGRLNPFRYFRVRRLEARGFVLRDKVWYGLDCTRVDLGVVSRRVITNGGVGFIVDGFQNMVELENMNFHAMGTTATAEAVTDTGPIAEVETRVSGTQSEPASNQIRTIGTQTATATRAIVEHALMSASSGGVCFDRSTMSVINLANGDSVQWTYTGTFTPGGT